MSCHIRKHWILALLFLVAGSGPTCAQQGVTPDAALTGRIPYDDRVEIEELLYRYCYYIDNRIGDAFASTFTPDGTLEFPGTVLRGHDQLAAFGSRAPTDRIRTHFVGDILLRQTASGEVHARSMVIVALRNLKEGGATTFEGVGIYDDRIVKTPTGWRFLLRHADKTIPVSSDFLPGVDHRSGPTDGRPH